MNRPGIRGVVFDLDGVLVDSSHVMEAAFRHAYRQVVSAVDEAPFEAYRQYLGWLFSDIMAVMNLSPAMEGPFVGESERLIGEIRVYPGVIDMLERLRKDELSVAVATGKVRTRADSVLRATGLAELVDAVVGSDEVPSGKPAPDIYHEALRRLDLSPAESLSVGDAPADVIAARRAGLVSVAAMWGESDRFGLLASQPDHVIEGPGELLRLCGLA